MTNYELVKACVTKGDQDVNIRDLKAVLTNISPEFNQTDCHAIRNFLDINKSNTCTVKEFLSQIEDAERLLHQHYNIKA